MKPWQEYCDSTNWHAAANIFPLMPEDELQQLADDIKTNGLKNPIILLDDNVLDGRNRMLACKLASVSPDFQSRNAEKLGSPVSWVVSQNLHRRHLKPDQLKAIAAEAVVLMQKETEARQIANLKQNQRQQDSAQPTEVEKSSTSEKSRDAVAKNFGLSGRTLQPSITNAKERPDIHQLQKEGKISQKEAQVLKHDPTLLTQFLNGTFMFRRGAKARKTPEPASRSKDLQARYAEEDFYARVARGLAGAFNGVKDRLDELTHIKKSDWSLKAEVGLQEVIKSLNAVTERADEYASQYKTILKSHKKAA